jgi:hypothetical protein
MPVRMTDDPINPNQPDYLGKVNEAQQSILIRSARFDDTADGRIYFKVDVNSNKAVACVVTIDKL